MALRLLEIALSAATISALGLTPGVDFTWSLGPERVNPYPSPHPYQFPDSAFAYLPDGPTPSSPRLMFWSDGLTYRVVGSGEFPANTPTPLTPVLGTGPLNTSYDANGNWMLAVFPRSEGGANRSLVGFTHCENHQFSCPGGYAEWNAAAVVTSDDDGVSWTRTGLAVYDEQPCKPTFGGTSFSSVIPRAEGFLAYGGCSAFSTDDAGGAPGTWQRWYNGNFSQPGIGGQQDCLPGLGENICCPIVHFNSGLNLFIMLYTTWGNSSALFVAASLDGLAWGPSATLLVLPTPRALGYGAVVGPENTTTAGLSATLVYASAPPTSPYPRDFVSRSITFKTGSN